MSFPKILLVIVISLAFFTGLAWQKTNTLSNRSNFNTSPINNRVIDNSNSEKVKPTANPTSIPTQKVVLQQAGWRKVKSWSGNGIMTTGQFAISSKQWRINYTLSPSKTGYAQLQVFVYTPQQDYAVESPIFTSTPGNGTSNIYRSGTFYLKILGMENWTIEVEELI